MDCQPVENMGDAQTPCVRVRMSPVVGDGGEENASFSKWTPSGLLELTITNPDAIPFYVEGQQYYVDMTKAGKIVELTPVVGDMEVAAPSVVVGDAAAGDATVGEPKAE